MNESAPAVSRSTTRSHSRKSASSSTVPSSCSTDCTVTSFSVAAASWSRVDSASRNEPRAERATSASAWSGTSIFSWLGDHPQPLQQVLQARALEHERLAARPDRPEHLREIGGAEDEDEVGRRLFDELQQRVPRRVA